MGNQYINKKNKEVRLAKAKKRLLHWKRKQTKVKITQHCNTGLAKVPVQCSASTIEVKIATFALPENFIGNIAEPKTDRQILN